MPETKLLKRNPGQSRWISSTTFLAPAVIFFALFSWWPIIWSFVISFQEYNISPNIPSKWVGFENYRDLFSDRNFYRAWRNVIMYVGMALVIGFFVPVVLAILINELRHIRGFLRLSYYLPAILPVVVISLIWKYLYHPGPGGFFNTLLHPVTEEPIRWFYTDPLAIFAMVIMTTWRGAGATMIIYLAAIGGIPSQLYEAAEIDGASIWRRLWHITIPELVPIMSIILILQMLGTFKIFAEPYIMTKGKTVTVMTYIYEKAFHSMDPGVATAMSMTLFAALVILSVVYFYVQKKVLAKF